MIQHEEMSKRRISWEEIDTSLERIKDVVRERYSSLFGIPRGGLIVALLLSYKTGLPVVLDEEKINKDTLIVDDIADQGTTLRHLFSNCEIFGSRENCPDAFALYFRTREFTFVFEENTQDVGDAWLVFPWEDEESSKYDGTFV